MRKTMTTLMNNKGKITKSLTVVLCAVIVSALLFFIISSNNRKNAEELKASAALEIEQANKEIKKNSKEGVVEGDIIIMPTIDYKELTKDKDLERLMATRKAKVGIKKSLDMIVKSDENFTVGDVKISMRDILENAFIKEGEVFEEKIDSSGAVIPQKIKEYGIYVVQPGDNIWNIHFNILKEFYEYQGIDVSSNADEPVISGLSSGVGKILKFSETMVIIYNLIDKKVVSSLDLLEPLSKVIVYNMDEVFSLLQEVNYDNIDRIQFDGKTIWIPAKKS
jgi:hypothetical protein